MADIIAGERLATVDLLKMDVEGHEVYVLRGLASLLERKAVKTLCIERNCQLLGNQGFMCAHLNSIPAHYGYIGCFVDGTSVELNGMCNRPLENLFYFADPETYRMVYGKEPKASQFECELIEEAFDEAICDESAAGQRRRIIDEVRRGSVRTGIELAEALLKRQPEETVLRGHLACWYASIEEWDQAEDQYEEILRRQPQNSEAAELLRNVQSHHSFS